MSKVEKDSAKQKQEKVWKSHKNNDIVGKNECLDDLHIKGYKIIQRVDGFKFGMDAVLLSGFAKVKKGENVLDLGTGTGILPILLAAKTKGKSFMGLEIQKPFVDMATRSVTYNKIEDRVAIVEGNIKEATDMFPLSSFDVITSNPPYMNNGDGLKNDEDMKTIARHEVLCTLEDIIVTVARLLKVKGRFYMVHRPHRIAEIIALMKANQLEPKTIRFVHPKIEKEANMVLIEAIRGANPMVKLLPPLIVYGEDNEYTGEIYEIYGKA